MEKVCIQVDKLVFVDAQIQRHSISTQVRRSMMHPAFSPSWVVLIRRHAILKMLWWMMGHAFIQMQLGYAAEHARQTMTTMTSVTMKTIASVHWTNVAFAMDPERFTPAAALTSQRDTATATGTCLTPSACVAATVLVTLTTMAFATA